MGAVQVLVVCTGNICRSPMAEVVLRDRFDKAGLAEHVAVQSAAISTEEVGNPIDSRARRVLEGHGYAVPPRRAQQVTARQLHNTDLVLAMTAQHARSLRWLLGENPQDISLSDVEAQAPGATRTPSVSMYRAFDPQAPESNGNGEDHRLDVDDPWYHDEAAFEVCLEQIEAAADGVVAWVRDYIESQPASSEAAWHYGRGAAQGEG